MHINKDAGLPPQPDAYLMAVSITSTGDASVATRLFKTSVAITGDCDVTADGRFLIKSPPAALNPVATPIIVDLNWTATLHKK
jgi:hypothetical protein